MKPLAAIRWAGVLALGVLMPALASAADTVRTLYLVRHGSYEQDPKADPAVGPGLSPLGLAQARLIAARFAGMPVHFDSITSSTMTRAKDTAAAIRASLPNVPYDSTPQLSECTPPLPRPMAGNEQAAMVKCANKLDEVFAKRFVPSPDADRNEVLVCHGNVIRYLVEKALGQDPRGWIAMDVAHASLSIIQVDDNGAIRVIAIGDIGHIPPNLQSWAGGAGDPQLVNPKY